jgi:hypothetical protein
MPLPPRRENPSALPKAVVKAKPQRLNCLSLRRHKGAHIVDDLGIGLNHSTRLDKSPTQRVDIRHQDLNCDH